MTKTGSVEARRIRSARHDTRAVIDWEHPEAPRNWLLGAGATRTERHAVRGATTAMVAAAMLAADAPWAVWQWLVVVVLTIDVAGGVAANALGTAKRFYHSPLPASTGRLARVLHHPVGFAAIHLQPFIVAAVLPDARWTWAGIWWSVAMAGTIVVAIAPLYLQRVVAAAVVTTALIAAPLISEPTGLAWFGPVMVLKLVSAHAVREEPYRPAPAPSAGRLRT